MQDEKKNSSLLLKRSFWPIFWVQFLGAFNDNVYKNALVILITYKSYQLGPLSVEQLIAFCGGIFILPFILFSAMAGELADKFSKSKLVFWVKVWEIGAMLLGLVGFYFELYPLLLFTLFMMGTQSAFFGPVKYSILPELLEPEELVTGNAYFEFGTFIAILIGTIVGGLLIIIEGQGVYLTGIAVVLFAILGTLVSLKIPKMHAVVPDLKLNYQIIRPTLNTMKMTGGHRSVIISILAISWFWYLGATLLSILPPFCKSFLNGPPSLITFCLAIFSIGVGIGSLACAKISREKLELGLIPIGAAGLSIFLIEIYFAGENLVIPMSSGPLSYHFLFSHITTLRIFVDLLLFSFCGGIFIVPLYTLLQARSPAGIRSRIIASNNIYNSIFMVFSSLILMVLFSILTLPQLFLFMGVANIFICAILFTLTPEFIFSLKERWRLLFSSSVKMEEIEEDC